MVMAQADAFELAHPSTIYTDDNVDVLTGATREEVELKLVTTGISVSSIPVLPAVGKWVEQDRLYAYEGKIYKCIQGHYRTIYSPGETLALFNVYRTETTDMQWIAGEKVTVGAIRLYSGKKYRCIQAHVTAV